MLPQREYFIDYWKARLGKYIKTQFCRIIGAISFFSHFHFHIIEKHVLANVSKISWFCRIIGPTCLYFHFHIIEKHVLANILKITRFCRMIGVTYPHFHFHFFEKYFLVNVSKITWFCRIIGATCLCASSLFTLRFHFSLSLFTFTSLKSLSGQMYQKSVLPHDWIHFPLSFLQGHPVVAAYCNSNSNRPISSWIQYQIEAISSLIQHQVKNNTNLNTIQSKIQYQFGYNTKSNAIPS